MTENIPFLSKAKLYLKREWLVILIFSIFIILSQALILKHHLEFGFSPDDVWLFSDFSSLGSTPILKFPQVWKYSGPHFTSPLYYNGFLYTFFGFNYQAYQITALVFKILSIISFYLLINIITKNRLLSFLSASIYSFHYGSIGSMEMVTRTQDYLVITGINIFLIVFYLIFFKGYKDIIWKASAGVVLLTAFFINPIRAYPIFPFICFLAVLSFLKNKSLLNLYQIIKNLLIIVSPFLLFFGLQGTGYAYYGNSSVILQKVIQGNLQLLLSPFTTLGSFFLMKEDLIFLSLSKWSLNTFPNYFFGGPLIFFGIVTFITSRILSKKPWRFFLLVFMTNFILDLFVFFIIDHGLNLPSNFNMNYDAYTYAPSAILGIFVLTTSIFTFIEWINNRQNIYLIFYLLGMAFALTFIWFTWIFHDYVNIPMGIYGYATIPAMGISAAFASVLTLAYYKLKDARYIKIFASTIFLILIPYFLYSNSLIQKSLIGQLNLGMKAEDQVALKNKFWSLVSNPSSCDKFFYIDKKDDIPNGYFYDFIMIARFDRWYNLYSPYQSKKPCPVAILLNEEEKLYKSYTSYQEREGFLIYTDEDSRYISSDVKEQNVVSRFIPFENFYAFRLQNREIINIKEEIMEKLKKRNTRLDNN